MGSVGQPVPAPRVALFSGNQQFFWNDVNTTPFNGFVLIALIPPKIGAGTPWAQLDYGNLSPSIELPLWQRIPIIDGQLNSSCGLFLNTDIVPPGSTYVAWYYDSTGTQVAGPTSQFTVTSVGSNSFTPPILTLTAPTTAGANPTPDIPVQPGY